MDEWMNKHILGDKNLTWSFCVQLFEVRGDC